MRMRLLRRIQTIYDHHKGRYGYRRITTVLRQAGEVINHKTAQRLMQQLGLKSLVRPKRYRAYRGAAGYAWMPILRHTLPGGWERATPSWKPSDA